MAGCLTVGGECCVPHVERVESAFGKKGCVRLMRCGLQGVTEEIEGNIRVESGGAGSTAEALVWQPTPADAVIGKGEVRRFGRSIAQFPRKAGRVCREIGERDGPGACGYQHAGWSEALERIVEPYCLVRDKLGVEVGGKDLFEREEPQQRVLRGKMMGMGGGFAVAAEKHLIAANDDENHTGGVGLSEKICA